jgi:hypothetical protein
MDGDSFKNTMVKSDRSCLRRNMKERSVGRIMATAAALHVLWKVELQRAVFCSEDRSVRTYAQSKASDFSEIQRRLKMGRVAAL